MDQQLLRLRVGHIERPVPGSAHLFFEMPGQALPDYQAGQFLTLLFSDIGPSPLRRSYSLASAPGVDSGLSICVKRTPNGVVSDYLTRKVAVGDELRALPPAGRFVLPEPAGSTPEPLLMVAGGSGVVPIFSLLKEALSRPAAPEVHLLLANRNASAVFFRERLQHWAKRFPARLKVLHLLSQPTSACARQLQVAPQIEVRSGRLSNAWLEQWVEACFGKRLPQVHAYICGPPGLMLKAEMTLKFMGVGPARLHKEDFIIHTPFRPSASQLPEATVALNYRGRAYTFKVAPGQTVLEGAQQAGIELPYSCRSGSCATCSAQIVAGQVDMYTHDSRMDSAATRGHVFTCVAYPTTEAVRLRVD